MFAPLREADPEVVAVPGWSDPGALSALLWCLSNGRPAVLMSESGQHDAMRRRALEALKARVVRLFASALVGGALELRVGRAGKQVVAVCPPSVGADGQVRAWNGVWKIAPLPVPLFRELERLARPRPTAMSNQCRNRQ